MRKTIKVISSAGSVAMLLAGTAMAAPPTGVGFDNWEISGGNVDVVGAGTGNPCPTGYTCQELAKGTGFLQQQITETASGKKYFWTVISEGADGAANLAGRPFASEDFVQLGTGGSSVPGLYANQRISDGTVSPIGTAQSSVTNGFSTSTQISTGWAVNNVANSAETVINLNVSDAGVAAANDEFLSAFNVVSATPALGGANVVSALTVDQVAWIGDTTAAAAPSDRQHFYTKLVASTAASPVGGFTFTPGGGAAVTVQGTPVDWTSGDKIQVVWVGQTIGGLGSFGAENLTQVTGTTLGTVSSSSTTATGPWDWTAGGTLATQFGTAPTF
ncbi:MAG: hypothetical protein ACOY4D_13155 [Pseudomonadota bacterium]